MEALTKGNTFARTRGYAKFVAEVAALFDSHDRDPERYNFSLFKKLVEANSNRLNIDTNPFETKALLVRNCPVRIHAEEIVDEEEQVDVNSAADW